MYETNTPAETSIHPGHLRQRRWLVIVFGLLLVVVVGSFVTYNLTRTAALPRNIIKQVSFTIFYPAPMPKNYSYQAKSANLSNEILFYKLRSGNRVISVNEQSLPPNPPNLASFPGFNKLSVDAGSAVAGVYAKTPTVVITNNTTLITIIGSDNVPYDIIVAFAAAMHSLPRQ